MIKSLFAALTGIDESIDDDDSQESWEHQKYLDDNDLDDFDFDFDATDDNQDSDRAGEGFSGWFGLW